MKFTLAYLTASATITNAFTATRQITSYDARQSSFRIPSSTSATKAASDSVAADYEVTSPSDILPSGAKAGQAEVVLVGCGAPNRGMGWYHAVQMLEGRYVLYDCFDIVVANDVVMFWCMNLSLCISCAFHISSWSYGIACRENDRFG